MGLIEAIGRPGMKSLRGLLPATVLFWLIWPAGAPAEVVRSDHGEIAVGLARPIHTWQDDAREPKAVVLALHGATLHGRSFDRLGRLLAAQGFLVVAPDLRGFGRWCHDESIPVGERTMHFTKTEGDLAETLGWIRARYPDKRLFCVGESLGSNWALVLAAKYPDKTDGLILSSPSVKRRSIINPRALYDLVLGLTRINQRRDISLYIERCISEDGRVVEERLRDPLARNAMSVVELIKIGRFMSAATRYAARVPEKAPVLIIQGTEDRIVDPDSVRALTKVLKSDDVSVCWRERRGHIALQTDFIQDDVLNRVERWLDEHVSGIKRAQR